jgi:hypothetical protein
MEHWWKSADRIQPKYSEKNLYQRHFVSLKSNMDWQGNEPGPQRLRHGSAAADVSVCVSVNTQVIRRSPSGRPEPAASLISMSARPLLAFLNPEHFA